MSDDKIMSDENRELDDPLGQHLRYLYNTKLDDRQSLAHIRERLLKTSQESLPGAHNITAPFSQVRQIPPEPLYHARPPAWRRRILWSQRALQLVAILLVAAITGALVLVLTLSRAISGGNGSSFSVRPGWEQVAVYSGKGNGTITGLKRSLPQIWATSITCTGDGAVNIKMLGVNTDEELGTDSCQLPQLTLNQPTSFSYNRNTAVVIQTIKVTAHATTSWQLHLLQATSQPKFQLGSEWKWTGVSGSGNGITFTRNSQNDRWVPQSTPTITKIYISSGYAQTSAQSWGILTICFGHRNSHLQLSPDVGNLSMPICDGQPRLTVLRFPTTTTVYTMTVYAEGDMIWSAGIASCIDEARCQIVTALHVIPRSTTHL